MHNSTLNYTIICDSWIFFTCTRLSYQICLGRSVWPSPFPIGAATILYKPIAQRKNGVKHHRPPRLGKRQHSNVQLRLQTGFELIQFLFLTQTQGDSLLTMTYMFDVFGHHILMSTNKSIPRPVQFAHHAVLATSSRYFR